MPLRYHVLDVFTDTPLAGNPLAVVMEADGLSDARMQALAAEFNLSETVFVLAPSSPMHRARLRIFTPKREIPFAGHPTVGTAALLAAMDAEGDGEDDRLLTLEEGVGPVRIGVSLGQAAPYAEFDIPKLPKRLDAVPGREALASALGLMANELGFANHAPCAFDAGLPYVCVPVRDEETLARARPITALWKPFGEEMGAYLYTPTRPTSGTRAYAARMFDPSAGIPEDPATGSAAACLSGAIHRFDGLKAGATSLTLHQGREMGRPSRIDLTLTLDGAALGRVRIGGHAVRVASGELLV